MLCYYSMTAMNNEARPVYLKLRDLIVASILDGTYSDGDPLPSVRAFAAEHGANPLTVAKAYQTFQDDDLVAVRRGIGMFVAQGATKRLLRSEREAFITEYWPRVAEQIRRLDLDVAELMASV